jgi:NAD+ kinase
MVKSNTKRTLEKPVIFVKSNNKKVLHATHTVITHLTQLGKSFLFLPETAKLIGFEDAKLVSKKQSGDCVIVIGGDGSLLASMDYPALSDLPIIGVNLGNVGFLTDINPNDLKTLTDVLSGSYTLETRTFIETAINQSGSYIALNDIVISRYAARLLNFDLFINHEFICSQRADGAIISTPTGSTAYALSAGGPIIHPEMQALSIIPLCPHRLNSRPLIVSDDSIIDIYLSNIKSKPDVLVSCDGKKLEQDNISQLTIKKSTNSMKLLHPKYYNYFHTLKSKLHWEKPP